MKTNQSLPIFTFNSVIIAQKFKEYCKKELHCSLFFDGHNKTLHINRKDLIEIIDLDTIVSIAGAFNYAMSL